MSGQGTVEDFEPAALACAAHFKEPGPAATGIPLPRHARQGQQIKIEVVAMLGEDGQRSAAPPCLARSHSGIGLCIFPISTGSNAMT